MVPTFSVTIPTYNAASYLGDAIESVLAQTFDDFELVICDDASSDETPELVRRYDDSRLRYLPFEENLGQSGNFNRCIQEARGELWTMLSADDRLLPAFLARAHDAFARHPDAAFFVPAYERIDEAGTVLEVTRAWSSERVEQPGAFLDDLLQGAEFHTLGLVVRRAQLAGVGDFRTDVHWAHDWDWILRLVADQGGVYSPEPLTEYREHDGSGTAAALQAGINGAAELSVLNESLRRSAGEIAPEVRRRALKAFAIRQLHFAEMAIELGSGSAARMSLRYALRASPWILTRVTFWSVLARSFRT